ncbi:MAG: MBL fold metallo-hydrolase [Deltaproteobacteria bacterium]|nr:MBL fold metallo-hydrolase [Deltaproteobacteria bacterium]
MTNQESVRLELLEVGHCMHPEHVVLQNRRFAPLRFPALVALIHHPTRGPILFDTGYSPRFLHATRPFPERFYAWVTPITIDPARTALAQLEARGIRASDITHVIVSHFHADHVAGLCDFPRARLVYLERALRSFLPLGRIRGTAAGFLRALLPEDLESRALVPRPECESVRLPPECAPFHYGVDLFGDGSISLVELPGHVEGQLGAFLRAADGSLDFLVADACWTTESVRRRQLPHPITRALFSSYGLYGTTLGRIADLAERTPSIRIVPAHCDAVRRLRIPSAHVGPTVTPSSDARAIV